MADELERGFPTASGGHSGGNEVDRSVHVGGRSYEPTGESSKRPVSES